MGDCVSSSSVVSLTVFGTFGVRIVVRFDRVVGVAGGTGAEADGTLVAVEVSSIGRRNSAPETDSPGAVVISEKAIGFDTDWREVARVDGVGASGSLSSAINWDLASSDAWDETSSR